MVTYKDAGVDVEEGDKASSVAVRHSASTFDARKNLIGQPLNEVGGFGGFLDMGDYYLVQTDDGTGTKIDMACQLQKYNTLGYDLLAMVADDIVCTGAEVISLTNTLDVPKVDTKMIDQLMEGLAHACKEQKIVIPAGEIAEVPGAVQSAVWSATGLGIVAKHRVLQPATIVPGDTIISLREYGPRSNGYSLIRHVLTEHPEQNHLLESLLQPSTIYHNAILHLLGRFGEERKVDIKGIAHITGGGIPSKLGRVLKKSGYGAEIHNPWEPPAELVSIMELGNISLEEAYKTWNMGNGMLLILDPAQVDSALHLLQEKHIEACVAGEITPTSSICIRTTSKEVLHY